MFLFVLCWKCRQLNCFILSISSFKYLHFEVQFKPPARFRLIILRWQTIILRRFLGSDTTSSFTTARESAFFQRSTWFFLKLDSFFDDSCFSVDDVRLFVERCARSSSAMKVFFSSDANFCVCVLWGWSTEGKTDTHED